jgi:hypothetical protein
MRSWAGFIGTLICVIIFYVGVLPLWNVMTPMMIDFGVSDQLIHWLDKGLYWGPLLGLGGALIHAIVSPAFKHQRTYIDDPYRGWR